MTFNPKCKDFPPSIFIVDGFVIASPDIQTPRLKPDGKIPVAPTGAPAARSFQQYPQQVTTAFEKALQDSLRKIVFKTKLTPPSDPPRSLFKVNHIVGI